MTISPHQPEPISRDPASPALQRIMRAREYFTLAFGTIVGVGWMIVIDDWLGRGGSLGTMLGFLMGGVALVPVAYVYGQLVERMPDAGSEVAYTRAVFPRFVSFATGWAMTLTYAIVCPYEAVAVGRLAAYAFPELNTLPLYEVGGHPVYGPHLLLGIGITLAVMGINYRGIRYSALLQNVTTFVLLGIFGIFATVGLFRGSVDNLPPFFPEGRSPVLSILMVLQIVPYFMTGFETVPKCSEEASASFRPSRFVTIMYWSLAVGTLFYVVVVGVVCLLQPWQSLLDVPFATAVAFDRAFGWQWLVQLIMIGGLFSLVKVFNGCFLASTRILYAMGRHDLLGGRLGHVHPRFQTPSIAILLVGALTFLSTFLGRAVLVPISEVGSLTCTFGWLATALAYCCGAGGNVSARGLAMGITAAVVSGALLVIAAVGFGQYEWLALAGWIFVGMLLWSVRSRV